jgi:hypothetical protein
MTPEQEKLWAEAIGGGEESNRQCIATRLNVACAKRSPVPFNHPHLPAYGTCASIGKIDERQRGLACLGPGRPVQIPSYLCYNCFVTQVILGANHRAQVVRKSRQKSQ